MPVEGWDVPRGYYDPDPPEDEETFEVEVWNHEGDIVRKVWEATYDEAEAIREEYSDEPLLTVVVRERGDRGW